MDVFDRRQPEHVVYYTAFDGNGQDLGDAQMTEIYLIRHAQAEGNSYRSMQGHWDGDVTAMGRRQIDCLAERFRDVKLDALYTSDLYRTRLTAGAITRYHDLPMHTSELLREIHVGRWETLFFGNVLHDEPESAQLFMYDPDSWFMEGAETYAQVADRAMEALGEIVLRHPDDSAVFCIIYRKRRGRY